MSRPSQSPTDADKSVEASSSSGDPYNHHPINLGETTVRRRTLDDMRKLSEEIKSVRVRTLQSTTNST
jgi:hypothetical protein